MENIDLTNTDIWREIEGYDKNYYVSRFGEVYSTYQNILRKIQVVKKYCMVNLHYKGKRRTHSVHRLVAIAFIPNPENKPEVNHKDTIKHNNCVDNLEWNTHDENQDHAIAMGVGSRRRTIERKCLTTGETKTYNSMSDAVKDLYPEYNNFITHREKEHYIHARTVNIRRVLNGKAKTHKNYIFRYV